MPSYQPGQTFNLGNAMLQGERIKGMRSRNQLVNQQSEQAKKQRNTEIMYRAAKTLLENPQMAEQIDAQLKQEGIIKPEFTRDYNNIDEIKKNAAIGMNKLEPFLTRKDPSSGTSEIKNYNFRQNLATPEDRETFDRTRRGPKSLMKVDLGDRFIFVDPVTSQMVRDEPKSLRLQDQPENIRAASAAKSSAQLGEELKVKPVISSAIIKEEGIAERGQNIIESGRGAAKGIPVLKRTLALLNKIKTGGFRNLALRAKQLLGVEGADEGELSANMGQAILGDLRSTFGAQFTEQEGARLERIRANFGKNAGTNKRLIRQALEIAEDAAKRAMTAAKSQGDTRTAKEIQDALDFKFSFDAPTQDIITYDPVTKKFSDE